MAQARRLSIPKPVSVQGTGLHTGTPVTMKLVPAEGGQGIVFRRTDLRGAPDIPATAAAVHGTERRTELRAGDATVTTTEHVLAAVTALGLDDLIIELDGPEPPAGDGSSSLFFDALRKAGTAPTAGEPAVLRVLTPIRISEGDTEYVVAPAKRLRLAVTIEWPHPMIGRQSGCYDIAPEPFAAELSRARTFGFESEARELGEKELARGSAGAAIRLSATGVVDTDLRWPDEFVRHKAVDLLGDLALLGGRLEATVVAFRPGHRGNLALVRALGRVTAGAPAVMGIEQILGTLPHRYTMLLVDRILSLERDRVVGIKNVTINEPFFAGHFPGHPIMPAVLIIEAMAQVGGVLLMGAADDAANKAVYFMSIDNVKFRRPVVPGDQIRFELEMLQFRGTAARMRGVALVDGEVAAEAEMLAGLVDR